MNNSTYVDDSLISVKAVDIKIFTNIFKSDILKQNVFNYVNGTVDGSLLR